MTMDVSHRKPEMKSDVQVVSEEVPKSVKRSFDVAFLMLPDEKLASKTKFGKYYSEEATTGSSSLNNNDKAATDSDEEIEVGNNNDIQKPKSYQHLRQQVFDDPRTKLTNNPSEQKSAFTKVSLSKDHRVSPSLSVSPDLSYQSSLSPSPPIINRNYPNFIPPDQLLKSPTVATYQASFLQDNFPPNTLDPSQFLIKTTPPELLPKIRPSVLAQYPPAPYNYQPFQPTHQDILKMAQHQQQPEMRNPAAAAILTTLLPPSLAALSLPAQNVCAKCNVSFRMTSDLVYHMRSHHKNDSVDYTKKRREDKLKCPVCSESFRERHHLTRHMTAHQDKDEDGELEVKKKGF